MQRITCTLFSARGRDSFTQEQQNALDAHYDMRYCTATSRVPGSDFFEHCKDTSIIGLTPRSLPIDFKSILPKLDNLKHIALPTTGTEWIDIAFIRSCGVSISHVPGFSSVSCAEFTMGILLSIARNIPKAISNVNNNITSNSGLCGFELRGKNIGVIGLGNVGVEFAKLCNGFGMKVFGYDIRSVNIEGVTQCSLNQLIDTCNIITLHIPLTAETHHFVNESFLSEMKQPKILLNVSRPGLVDNNAIVQAIYKKQISSYAVDMGYCDQSQFKGLLATGSALVVPHVSWYTKEAIARETNDWVATILSYASGTILNRI